MIDKIKENIKTGMQDVKKKALEDGEVIASAIKENVAKNVNDAADGAKEFVGNAAQVGIEVGMNMAKKHVHSTVNLLLLKFAMFSIFIVVIIAGGCVGSNVLVDKFTDKEKIEAVNTEGK